MNLSLTPMSLSLPDSAQAVAVFDLVYDCARTSCVSAEKGPLTERSKNAAGLRVLPRVAAGDLDQGVEVIAKTKAILTF
jgi:hypothetical protein